jgi:hypothetical protein
VNKMHIRLHSQCCVDSHIREQKINLHHTAFGVMNPMTFSVQRDESLIFYIATMTMMLVSPRHWIERQLETRPAK